MKIAKYKKDNNKKINIINIEFADKMVKSINNSTFSEILYIEYLKMIYYINLLIYLQYYHYYVNLS